MTNSVKLDPGTLLLLLKDTPAVCMTYYVEPHFGRREVLIPKGETLKVSDLEMDIDDRICCDMINYDRYHSIFVSEEERKHSHYGGYFLLISRELLRENSE